LRLMPSVIWHMRGVVPISLLAVPMQRHSYTMSVRVRTGTERLLSRRTFVPFRAQTGRLLPSIRPLFLPFRRPYTLGACHRTSAGVSASPTLVYGKRMVSHLDFGSTAYSVSLVVKIKEMTGSTPFSIAFGLTSRTSGYWPRYPQ